ncbi:MAG: hypothetical protein GQF41_2380 [Candidatus Rifleibacterium amylolyticum]|nr:MAG: hypothetical protein GQF41_2380 [Candidatus Rifleibacterium amylolyticum]
MYHKIIPISISAIRLSSDQHFTAHVRKIKTSADKSAKL